jgi:hypothetical protein
MSIPSGQRVRNDAYEMSGYYTIIVVITRILQRTAIRTCVLED